MRYALNATRNSVRSHVRFCKSRYERNAAESKLLCLLGHESIKTSASHFGLSDIKECHLAFRLPPFASLPPKLTACCLVSSLVAPLGCLSLEGRLNCTWGCAPAAGSCTRLQQLPESRLTLRLAWSKPTEHTPFRAASDDHTRTNPQTVRGLMIWRVHLFGRATNPISPFTRIVLSTHRQLSLAFLTQN